MTVRIQAAASAPVVADVADVEAPKTPKVAPKAKDARVHKIALEFESMLVRQLLTAAKMGGHGKEDAYSGMAVDAFASGIEKSGGLGLARQIEDSLAHSAAVPIKESK